LQTGRIPPGTDQGLAPLRGGPLHAMTSASSAIVRTRISG
jgi:hypothetical protein